MLIPSARRFSSMVVRAGRLRYQAARVVLVFPTIVTRRCLLSPRLLLTPVGMVSHPFGVLLKDSPYHAPLVLGAGGFFSLLWMRLLFPLAYCSVLVLLFCGLSYSVPQQARWCRFLAWL